MLEYIRVEGNKKVTELERKKAVTSLMAPTLVSDFKDLFFIQEIKIIMVSKSKIIFKRRTTELMGCRNFKGSKCVHRTQ